MWREILYLILSLVLFCFGLEYFYSFTDDPREPPRLRSKFPLLGHPIGLARNYRHYYTIARLARSLTPPLLSETEKLRLD